MNSIAKFANVFPVAFLSGTLAMPAFGQGIDVQAGGTGVQAGSGEVDVDVDVDDSDSRRDSRPESAGGNVGNSLNAQIASWARTDQQSIVELAQFGVSRTQTPAVKELANTISRAHRKLAEQLAKFAPADLATSSIDANSERRPDVRDRRQSAQHSDETTTEARRDAARDRDGVRTPLENLGDRVENRVDRLADRAEQAADATRDAIDRSTMSEQELRRNRLSHSPWLNIHHEIAAELDRSARHELQQYKGYEFDASFIGMLIASHLQQEATLKVLSQLASGDLANTLETALVEIRQHREHAETVMNSIKPRS